MSRRFRTNATQTTELGYGFVRGPVLWVPTKSGPPTFTSITPNVGSAAGGVSVTIAGTNFQAGAAVTIGGAACTSVTVVSPISITAVTPAATLSTLGAQNVVVTQGTGVVTGTGAYTQRLQLSYDCDGVDEYARASGLGAIPDGALTIAGWWYLRGGSKYLWTACGAVAANPAEGVGVFNSGNTEIAVVVRSAGDAKVYQQVTTLTQTAWNLCVITRTAAGEWKAHGAPLAGALLSSAGQTWTPTPTTAVVTENGNWAATPSVHNSQCAVVGIWTSDLVSSGAIATWLANPQTIPASPVHIWVPGLGDTVAGGVLTDRGTTGGWNLTMENEDAGDIVAAYPGVA